MAYVEVDIDIDDYLEDASTEALKAELRSRKEEIEIETSDNALAKLNSIKEQMGLRPWHSGERLLEEVKELISFATGETI